MPSESGKLSYTVNWLSDMIPIDIKVARIFTFGFSSSQSLRSIATRLLVDLVSVRTCSTAVQISIFLNVL